MSSNKSFWEKLKESAERGRERAKQENIARQKAEQSKAQDSKAQQSQAEQSKEEREYAEWENKGMLDIYREMGRGIVKSVPAMTKGVIRAHGIDSFGAPSTSYTSSSPDSNTNSYSSSHGPQFGEDGNGGRYPQGVNTTDGQPVAQSSTGPPHEVNYPEVKVDPINAKWP